MVIEEATETDANGDQPKIQVCNNLSYLRFERIILNC